MDAMVRRIDPRAPLFLTIAVLALWCAAALSGAPWAEAFDLAHWTLAAWGAWALVWVSQNRSRPSTTGWVLRRWTAGALAANGLGQLAYDVAVWTGQPGLLWLGGLFYAFFGPLLMVGLIRSWGRRPGDRRALGITVDSTLLTLGLVALLSALILPFEENLNAEVLASTLVFPALLFGAFALGVVLVLHDDVAVTLPSRIATLAILFALAVVQMVWSLGILNETPAHGTPVNLASSLLIVGLAWSVDGWSWSRRTRVGPTKTSTLILLPVIGLITCVVALFLAITDPRMPTWAVPLYALLAVPVGCLSVVRQGTLARSLRQGQEHQARNAELEMTVERLRETQNHLIQSAKLAALGQLVAGIAHDLNTPLGAIRSSSGHLEALGPGLAGASLDAVERLSLDQRRVFRALLDALSPDQRFVDSRSERALRRRWAARAESLGHPGSEALAQGLVDAGLGHEDGLVEQLLSLEDPLSVVRALEPYATAFRLGSVIRQASDKASDVVLALHNYLRAGTESARRTIDVSHSIRGVLPLFQHRVGGPVTVGSSLAAGARVWAWPEKLSQVWVNLVTNAVQAVGAAGRVEVSVTVADRTVVVAVSDDGPGVPAGARDKIFEAFFTTKPEGEGTGLGLDVCRRVVEEVGGTIGFESRPGRTVFTVRLPLDTRPDPS